MAKVKKDIASVQLREDITPVHLRCSYGHCPAVMTLSDGDLLIIGKRPTADLAKQIEKRVGNDEFAVKISPEFFKGLFK